MRIFARGVVSVATIVAIVFAQMAAALPHKPPPYNVNWYLHPQRLVDVGGRRLNIFCIGTGSPTVILESGLVADSTAWRLVQPAISRNRGESAHTIESAYYSLA